MSVSVPRTPHLLVLDVDGTLLLPDGTMPPARAEALAAVSDVVPTIFATGKTWPSIAPLARRFELAGPHLTCNGAALVSLDSGSSDSGSYDSGSSDSGSYDSGSSDSGSSDSGSYDSGSSDSEPSDGASLDDASLDSDRVEVLSALARDTVDLVLSELHARGIATATYLADGTSVAPAWDDGFELIRRVAEAPPEIRPLPDDAEVLKILAVLSEDDEPPDLRRLAADRARIQRTAPTFLEWNASDASKGHGLELLARRHGIDLAHVVAVGDSENDVSMFAVAGHSVAVAAASDVAAAAADVTLSDDVAAWFTAVVAQTRASRA